MRRTTRLTLVLAFLLLLPPLCAARKYYVYVGRVETDSVLLAWGTADGRNTIGHSSPSHGHAEILIGAGRISESHYNWAVIRGLQPGQEYPYEVLLNGVRIGVGVVRTLPAKCDRLAFLVVGDYGNGKRPQYEVAAAMQRTIDEQARAGNPVRFILTTGDNIYADQNFRFLKFNSGNKDRHWGKKFFRPYEEILRSVPFYPTLGNHDGGESESSGDLAVYLDNFFFPVPQPSRYYSFSAGGLADFFAIDTTGIKTESGRPIYEAGSAQLQWLERELGRSAAPWKIAYFHHPPFNAGPGHGSSLDRIRPLVELLGKYKVQVAFSGHEHNFQWAARNDAAGGVQYVVTGAGGELRAADIRARLHGAGIAAWAPDWHFVLAVIESGRMRLHVLGPRPVSIVDAAGKPVNQPFVIER